MKRCSECDDAVFDHVEQEWYCCRTNVLLCVRAKWPNEIEAKSNLDELECYLEVDDGG